MRKTRDFVCASTTVQRRMRLGLKLKMGEKNSCKVQFSDELCPFASRARCIHSEIWVLGERPIQRINTSLTVLRMYTCICVPVEYLRLNRIIVNSDCWHASNRHSACRGRTLARGPGILRMFSRLHGRHLRNGSSSPQGAACATKLGIYMWSMHHGGVGSVLAQTTADRGASARGAKKRAAHILAYIQI